MVIPQERAKMRDGRMLWVLRDEVFEARAIVQGPIAEAYAAYGRESAPIFARVGGRIAWRGVFEQTLIGPTDERWDHCFVAEYPSVAAFVEMLRDPAYREAVKHRQAAVLDSRLIRLAPTKSGDAFG